VAPSLVGPATLAAQDVRADAAAEAVLVLEPAPDGDEVSPRRVPVLDDRGYAAVPAAALDVFGWRVARDDDGWSLALPDAGVRITARPGSPFLGWNGTLVQLAHEAYERGGELHLPLQFVTDLLPDRLSTRFEAPSAHHLRVRAVGVDRGDERARTGRAASRARAEPVPFVVVLDPGHGGSDPGAMGAGGVREKDVALALALVLRDSLLARPGIEVHLTREGDELVPLWRRGELATEVKGERPGVFISLHANALAARNVRGVETYFLSEARTEHERRVAALENAPLRFEGGGGPAAGDAGLDLILSELRNHDHQHWSADLASLVQRNLAAVHPGPNRGVKQGPFAVITNALMPAVLVEIGFLTHRDEERTLADAAFHARAAGALARAVEAFAGRYPPGRARAGAGAGAGAGGPEGRR
jgi:N-acetylmuramoyl-L-alanine amidase